MVLKNIPPNISPELMHTLMSMGHGDEIVIADANFPAHSCATKKLVRCDGLDAVELLDSIMKFLPIDKYVDDHVCVMALEPSDVAKIGEPPIWKDFASICKKEEGDWVKLTQIPRMDFYERAKKAFAVVATSESALYANIIIKKGVVPPTAKK